MSELEIQSAPVQNEVDRRRRKKTANPAKYLRLLDKPTALYRHFAADGTLLYVGIALSAIVRLKAHRGSEWFDQVTMVTIERFPNREAALKAECDAVYKERPAHNIQLRIKGDPYVPPETPQPRALVAPNHYWTQWAIDQFKLP